MNGLHPRPYRRARAGALAAIVAGLALCGSSPALAGATESTPAPQPAAPTPEPPTPAPAPAPTPTPDATPPDDFGVASSPPRGTLDAKAGGGAVVHATAGVPTVGVTPTTGLDPAGSTISVSGSGFDPVANNRFGIYVVFGPVDPATYFSDANRFLAAVWLHPGGGASGSPGQGELNADGSFAATLPPSGGLPLTARYTDGNGAAVDCLTTQCYVVTMAAHGVADRSQDTCTPVSFAGGTAVPQVDRSCRPVTASAGQPTGGGPTGSNPGGSTGGTHSNATGTGGTGATASSTLPSTGSAALPAAAAGILMLLTGWVLVARGRTMAPQFSRVAASTPLDQEGEPRPVASPLHLR